MEERKRNTKEIHPKQRSVRLVEDYEALVRHVKSLKGSPQVQAQTIQDIIDESLRFKRQHLANLLGNLLQETLAEKFQLMDNGAR